MHADRGKGATLPSDAFASVAARRSWMQSKTPMAASWVADDAWDADDDAAHAPPPRAMPRNRTIAIRVRGGARARPGLDARRPTHARMARERMRG